MNLSLLSGAAAALLACSCRTGDDRRSFFSSDEGGTGRPSGLRLEVAEYGAFGKHSRALGNRLPVSTSILSMFLLDRLESPGDTASSGASVLAASCTGVDVRDLKLKAYHGSCTLFNETLTSSTSWKGILLGPSSFSSACPLVI